jgi:hypothetical protein
MTSIGTVAATDSQVIQPEVKLAKEPKEKCGKRMTPAGDGEHHAEFGVVERHEDHHHRAQGPGDQRGGADHHRGVEGTEEPTGTDDRSDPGEQQADLSDISLQPLVTADIDLHRSARPGGRSSGARGIHSGHLCPFKYVFLWREPRFDC